MVDTDYSLRFFENDDDTALYHDLWLRLTRKLPRAQVKSVNSIKYQWLHDEFEKKSVIYAFNGKNSCIGCSSIYPGSDNFWCVDYPLLVDSGREKLRREIFEYLLNYAAENVETPYLSQRFREEWKTQIDFFQYYGFSEWFRLPIFGKQLEPFIHPVISEKTVFYENGIRFIKMKEKDYSLLYELSRNDLHGSNPFDTGTINYLKSLEAEFSWKIENKSGEIIGFFAVSINWLQKNAEINSILIDKACEDLEWKLFNFIHRRLAEKGIYEVYMSIFPDSKRIPFLLDSG
ncbi:MAG: hypothetical protein ACTSP4_11730, partial [Candidatus Hodarchaeales archaeon]